MSLLGRFAAFAVLWAPPEVWASIPGFLNLKLSRAYHDDRRRRGSNGDHTPPEAQVILKVPAR